MRKILLFLFCLIITSGYVSAYQEVSCSQYGSNANACDQCFDGGGKYEGQAFSVADYFDAGKNDRIYFADENPSNYTFQSLNSNTSWYVSNDLLRYPSTLNWYTQSSTGRDYLQFLKNTSTKFLETVPGKGIKLSSVPSDNVDPNIPAFKFTFTTKYRTFQNSTLGNIVTHNECVFYKANYCGDGIRQTSQGETCDPRDTTKTGWGNGGCDTNTCQPITTPTCESLTVNKTTGTAPTDVVATCTGYKVNTWKIDCGNGQVFTGNGNNSGTQTFNKTCNYTTGGSYTPTCTINNNITNNSCKKTVTISEPKIPSILVDKKDSNVTDLDGSVGNDTQTVYVADDAIFKIRVTNNGEESLKNIQLSDPVELSCATKGGTTVNLENKYYINTAGTNTPITVGGSGNHTNSTLEVGEWFEYTCKKANTQSNYTNTVTTTGVGITSNNSVTDSDPTQVIVVTRPNPEISVIKRDENANDLDGNIGGNDSQTVDQGNTAIFHITVENTGDENLKNVKLSDPLAAACDSNGANIDLQNKRFTNKSGSVVTLVVSGSGNHADNIFQVGEKFTYICSKPNTQSDYTNIVDVSGVGVTSNETVTDNDPTKVIVRTPEPTNPDITVVKEDANSNDLDGEQFNDTQTVVIGNEAVFHMTIRNTGDEDLKDISLIDTQAAACATKAGTFVNLSNATFTNKNNVSVTIYFDGAGNHSDNIFQVGEEFTYTCSQPNTQTGYTNIVEVSGVGLISGETVTDDDPTVVLVENPIYDLALVKLLSSATPGPFEVGNSVTFQISVINQGNTDASNIQITDYIPDGLTLSDANWTVSGDKATMSIASLAAGETKTRLITFTIDSDAPSTIRNYAEISSDDGDDCDSTPDATNGNQGGETDATGMIDNNIGNGCNPGGDEDDHDYAEITIGTVNTDVYLIKSLAPGQATTVNIGDTVHYIITVYNSGSVLAEDYKIEDHYEVASNGGLELIPDSNWTDNNGIAEYKELIDIPVNGSFAVDIYFKITDSATGTVRNLAVVCDGDVEDCDPVEPPVCDDETEVGTPEGCVEVVVPSCASLVASPSSAKNSLTSTLTCTGNNATSYKIEVRNASGNIVDTINGSTGNVTLTTVGNYTASCFINNETTTIPACIKPLQVTTGGGGGSTLSCTGASQSGSTVTCEGNSKAESFYLKCGDVIKSPKNTSVLLGQHYAEFDCSESTYQCYVDDDSVPSTGIDDWFTSQSWRTSNECRVLGGAPICGNGIVESGEQCDISGSPYTNWGTCGIPGSANACKLPGGGGGGGSCEDDNTCVLTWPNDGELIFGPRGNMTLGHNVNPLVVKGEKIYLSNQSDYDFSFDQLCVITRTTGIVASKNPADVVNSPSETCFDLTYRTIFAYETREFDIPTTFLTNKDAIPSGKDFATENIVTTLKDGGILYDNAYFAGKLEVRVAKPAISTVGGGTSYVKSTDTADVSHITNGGNTNFVGTSVSNETNAISSDTEVITDTNTVVMSNIDTEKDKIDSTESIIDTSVMTTNFARYNGLDTVYSKTGDYNLTNASNVAGLDLNNLTDPVTFIVEGGDLTISDDIIANKNIAFVVRGGDIIIKNNVARIDGTYIAINTGSGGDIIAEPTGIQLVVNGSLYGDISELVDNRYYISDSSGGLSVGTIVAFGSSLFTQPAPLVSQFVGEYLESTKVAK